MPRLLVVESDASRRASLHVVLLQAGFEISDIEIHEVAWHAADHALVIVGAADLHLLDALPRTEGRLVLPVLAVVDPGKSDDILDCLAAGVSGSHLAAPNRGRGCSKDPLRL